MVLFLETPKAGIMQLRTLRISSATELFDAKNLASRCSVATRIAGGFWLVAVQQQFENAIPSQITVSLAHCIFKDDSLEIRAWGAWPESLERGGQ